MSPKALRRVPTEIQKDAPIIERWNGNNYPDKRITPADDYI